MQPRAANPSPVTTYTGNLLVTYAPITTTDSNGALTTIPASTPAGQPTKAPKYTPYPKPITYPKGPKAAIGAAAVVACIFLGLILFCVCAQRRQRRRITQQDYDAQGPDAKDGMFGIFQPRTGNYHDHAEGKDAISLKSMPAATDHKHAATVHQMR